MPVNRERGSNSSVYCKIPIAERENHHLYNLARQMAVKYSSTKQLLDLGCSDMVASRILLQQEGFKVFGLDVDESSVRSALSNSGIPRLAVADLAYLPLVNLGNIDTVFMLDVLEHLSQNEAIRLLTELKAGSQEDLNIIITMPIISRTSLPCFRERIAKLGYNIKGQEPATGLFDQTHQILTDINGHKAIFRQAGYKVVEELPLLWTPGYRHGKAVNNLYTFVTHTIPSVRHPFDTEKANALSLALTSYQELYVIQPRAE